MLGLLCVRLCIKKFLLCEKLLFVKHAVPPDVNDGCSPAARDCIKTEAPLGCSISSRWLVLVQLLESAAPAGFFPSSAELQQQLFEFKKIAAKATFIAIQTQGSSPLQPLQHSNELNQQ